MKYMSNETIDYDGIKEAIEIKLDYESAQNINSYAVKEYLNEFNNIKTW